MKNTYTIELNECPDILGLYEDITGLKLRAEISESYEDKYGLCEYNITNLIGPLKIIKSKYNIIQDIDLDEMLNMATCYIATRTLINNIYIESRNAIQNKLNGDVKMESKVTIEEFEKYFEGEEIVNKEVLHTKLGQKLYMVTFDKPHDLDINNIYIYNVAYFKYYEDEEYFLFFNENDDKIADISATGFLSC